MTSGAKFPSQSLQEIKSMSEKQLFVTASPVRTPLNLAIVVLLAGGAAFGTTDAAAHGRSHQGYHGQDGYHGQYGHDGKGDQGGTCAKTTENTQDWYGEDVYGNVWYMGESTMSTNPENMLISVDGAWETAVDGAKPGIVVPAVFTDGAVYRQEWLLGDAEDIAENLSDKATESAPKAGVSCDQTCRKTHEYSPLEPDASESKFYAQGVGVIVTLDDNDPTFREELVTFTPGS
jgi:hypothetical protein